MAHAQAHPTLRALTGGMSLALLSGQQPTLLHLIAGRISCPGQAMGLHGHWSIA